MVRTLRFASLALAVLFVCGCCARVCVTDYTTTVSRSGMSINVADARTAMKLEVALDAQGHPQEIEYHISPDEVPAAVRKAMDGVAPGEDTGAEKEWNGGELYYELTRVVDGKKIEAMFRPDGTLHEMEAEVDADTVPEAARGAIGKTWPDASAASWEVIKDDDRQVVQYHAKFSSGGLDLKVLVSTGGSILGVYREVVSEIEVPMRAP